jgi:hypothetical protein
MRIELTIERLVLHDVGLDARHLAALGETLAAELAGSLGARRSWQPRRTARLRGAPVRLTRPAEPVAFGRAIARSVDASLTAPPRGG